MFRSSLYKEVSDFIKEAIAPSACVGCKSWGTWLCEGCAADLVYVKEQTCIRCKRLMLSGKTCLRCRRYTDLDGLIVALHYEDGPIREAVHEFKYGQIVELKQVVGSWLARGWVEHGVAVDFVTAVPLHLSRNRARGFNQAELLARYLADQAGLSYKTILRRARSTMPQVRLSRADRQQNVYKAFRVMSGRVATGDWLVIDDVATTGATLNDAARALKEAGARRVWGMVVARG